ncbi:MAG TPA: peroxiredoxin [Xanthobacteraceae bacterium]|nr:peroxiredoxin [Xanthobacteraceae bacterium]
MTKKTRPKTEKAQVHAKTPAVPKKAATRTVKAAAEPSAHLLTAGMTAPSFSLTRDGGDTVTLSQFAGRKLVIFFYPRADTPGCTREATEFTQLAGEFAACDTELLGVSADPVAKQERFRDKHGLTMPLASDTELDMLKSYEVWGEKSMYGRIFEGVLRTTVLIGRDGRIAQIWRNVKVPDHAATVLAAAKAL